MAMYGVFIHNFFCLLNRAPLAFSGSPWLPLFGRLWVRCIVGASGNLRPSGSGLAAGSESAGNVCSHSGHVFPSPGRVCLYQSVGCRMNSVLRQALSNPVPWKVGDGPEGEGAFCAPLCAPLTNQCVWCWSGMMCVAQT